MTGISVRGLQRAEARMAELWTAADASAADRHTMDVLGIPSDVLMERAALCVSAEVEDMFVACGADNVVILCGPGNNGGDGLAVARQLHGRGLINVFAYLVTPAHGETVARQLAWADACGAFARIGLPNHQGRRSIVVDALLGTGSRGGPRGAVEAALIWDATAKPKGRLAIDLPTGVDPDRGSVSARAFTADRTVTFARSKPGLHITPGRDHAGKVVIADIGISLESGHSRLGHALVSPSFVAEKLATFEPAPHKGRRGHVWVIGGSKGFVGASILAGTAALRAGAGLCTIESPATDAPSRGVARPELMFAGWGADRARADALVVGPGLVDPADRQRLAALHAEDRRPAVWDASALETLPVGEGAGPRVITPHPGEAAALVSRLSGREHTVAEIQSDRLGAAQRLAELTAAVVVLKGAGTIVATRDRVAIVCSGSSTLASAGTGDVLAGAIGAFLARGLDPFDAACLAAHLHGLAGERERPGALALDIADAFPELLAAREPEAFTPLAWPRRRAG